MRLVYMARKTRRYNVKQQRKRRRRTRGTSRGGNCVVLFKRHGCSWCEAMAPAWKEAKAMSRGRCVYDVEASQHGYTDAPRAKQEMLKRVAAQHVSGYPTVAAIGAGGKLLAVHTGDRSVEGLATFIGRWAGPVRAGGVTLSHVLN